MYNRRSHYVGITLIELMISLTISFLILTLLTTLYITSQQNLSLQIAINTIQENAQAALNLMRNDIHNAGLIGCARLTSDFPLINHTNIIFNTNNRISGTNHSITIRHAGLMSNNLIQAMNDDISLYISNNHYKMGDVVILSDCQSAEIFQITKIESTNNHSAKIIFSTPLARRFDQTAELRLLEINTYAIHPTSRTNTVGKLISALYLQNIKNRNNELIEGIDALEMKYTIIHAGAIMTVNADQISDWSALIGVHIALTVSAANFLPLKKIWYGYAVLH